MSLKRTLPLAFLILTFASQAYALPIDWGGVFAIDSTLIDSFTRSKDTTVSASDGNQVVDRSTSDSNDASFQTYIFRLKPTIVVNDSATLFGEFTTGYGNGGYFGSGDEQVGNNAGGAGANTVGNTLYTYNTYRSNLTVKQLYAKYYSDTATYIVGRQPLHWGMGALFNGGREKFDRHASIEDGIMAELTISNFRLAPFYMKVDNGSNLDKEDDIKSTGVMAEYINPEKDFSFGLLFAKRKHRRFSTELNSGINNISLESAEVKITDIYLEKGWSRFNIKVEVPILEGELGNVYTEADMAAYASRVSDYKARAFLTEMKYEFNPKWTAQINAGSITGDNGPSKSPQFQALYLHPNYQIANLLFRYNLYAVNGNNNVNIYDSYMTNTNFLKLMAQYSTDKWVWKLAFIWAKANETASVGNTSFNHQTNKTFLAVSDQNEDLGYELDLNFEYEWNTNVSIVGALGYHFVGDYFKFTNTVQDGEPVLQSVKNSYAAQIQAIMTF